MIDYSDESGLGKALCGIDRKDDGTLVISTDHYSGLAEPGTGSSKLMLQEMIRREVEVKNNRKYLTAYEKFNSLTDKK